MKYYLINNTIKKGSEMPEQNGYPDFEQLTSKWLSSLQPCEISESEFGKVKNNIFHSHKGNLSSYSEKFTSPIDITDIVEGKIINGDDAMRVRTILVFKQPTEKQVESDAVDLKLDILQIFQEEAVTLYNPDGKDSIVIYQDKFNTIANQIINLVKKNR